MSLPTISAASLRVLGCVLILFNFASLIRAATAKDEHNELFVRPTNPITCEGYDSYLVTEADCMRFAICLNGTKFIYHCPIGTAFHKEKRDCKPYSWVDGCTDGTGEGWTKYYRSPIIAGERVRKIVSLYVGTVHDVKGSVPAVGEPIGPYPRPTHLTPCDNLDSYHVTESNCKKFWICLNQVKAGFPCPAGKAFHKRTRNCQPYSWVSGCTDKSGQDGYMQYHKPSVVASQGLREIIRKILGMLP